MYTLLFSLLAQPALAQGVLDSDGDGLGDAEEMNVYGTDPYNADTDADGLGDGDEVLIWYTNPLDTDTDGGGVADGDEVSNGSDPLDASDDFGGGVLSFTLNAPTPGLAGSINIWSVNGAPPQSQVYVVYAMGLGVTAVPGCPGAYVELASPQILDSTMTDALGDGFVARMVPPVAFGQQMYFAAVDLATCSVTPPVGLVFQ